MVRLKLTKPKILSWFLRMISHIGIEIRSDYFLVSSGEYWTMDESLIQQYYVSDEGFVTVKLVFY